MADTFYRVCRDLGRSVFIVSARHLVVDAHHVPARGPVLIAASHTSPYDVPVLMLHAPRVLDFMSTTEVLGTPVIGPFFRRMHAFAHDRSRPDPRAVLTSTRRLRRGRAVAMFPEGQIRRGHDSVLRGGTIRPGIGRLSAMAGAPIVPAVVAGAEAYERWTAWLPLRRTHYGVIFGPPIQPAGDPRTVEETLGRELRRLHSSLLGLMGLQPPLACSRVDEVGSPPLDTLAAEPRPWNPS